MNTLYYGDNLTIMQDMRSACVDLIYLDPPFNSKEDYNLLYRTMTGKPVPEQVEAFCDTWEMDAAKEHLARTMPVLMKEHGIDDYYVDFWRLWMQALRNTQPHLLAYLIYMVQRLLYMKIILRPTGSIYLHCDPAASHYIKVMMDGIFGHNNFRNEIIWRRSSSHNRAKRWGPIHDTILFYTKSDHYTWNRVLQKHGEDYINRFYRFEDEHGRYAVDNLTGPGKRTGDSGQTWHHIDVEQINRHWEPPHDRALPDWFQFPTGWREMLPRQRLDILDEQRLIFWPAKTGGKPRFKRYYLDGLAGAPVQDIIYDITPLGSHSKDRLGYQTQKPVPLLKRIIELSSNVGDTVFDPFCGCGTTIYAAVETKRKWIGCDVAILSVSLIQRVLQNRYQINSGIDYVVDGVPVSIEQAEVLFKHDPFQFQHWAVERTGGFPMNRKVADKGIDGRIYFETHDGLKDMVLSVKGGNIRPTDIRDLRGVLEREDNSILAGFISLRHPTPGMQEEASRAGIYEYSGVPYKRIQLLTIKDIIEDKREFHTPTKLGVRGTSGQINLPLAEKGG